MSLCAVIFDLDGTLVDTESLWDIAMDDLLKEKFGKSFDVTTKYAMMGLPKKEAARVMSELYGLSINLDEFVALRNHYYHVTRERRGVVPLPGADALVRALHASSIRLALATSEQRPRAEDTLKRFGWDQLFSQVVVAEDVANGKPSPDIYVEAIRQLGCKIGDCIAVEDAPAGVESAKAAGLKTLGVQDVRYRVDLSKADQVVSSLESLTVENFKEMVA